MLDVRNLERRWIKYKIKTYLPYILGLLTIMTLLIGISLYKNTNENPQMVKKAIANIAKTQNIPTQKTEVLQTVLEPSMNFVQSFQSQLSDTVQPVESVPLHPVKPIVQNPPVPKVLNVPDSSALKPPLKAPPTATSNDKGLSVNRNNETKIDIESVERRFKETLNPNLGLFIARYYYDRGNYSDAYNFALKTNGINNKMDESWIIFAKSLVKLGKTEQAKKTLQAYISESNSDSARSLLDSIERGSFK